LPRILCAHAAGDPRLSKSECLNRPEQRGSYRPVNGQPPPLPTPPLPAPVPQQQVPLPHQGIGCFAKGCLTVLIIGFILMAGLIGGTWYLYRKAADTLTSSEPADFQIERPDAAQVRAAERSLARLKTTIATGQETTVAFTAADLNALLDRDPDFGAMRGRTQISIANSTMTIAVSMPLDDLPWSRMKGRWFNASTTFSFAYAFGMFRVDVISAEANGHQFPDVFLSNFVSSFNEGLNKGFQNEIRKNDTTEFWNHVKTMSLEGDKLVVTTQAD
jgi:hypothetical protein